MELITQEFKYYNYLEDKDSILKINQMPLNRIRLGNIKTWKDDKDLENILNCLLKDLNLSKTVNGLIICYTNSPRYNSTLSEYLFYVEHLNNYLKWNEWIDKLIKQHIFNLDFEKHYTPPIKEQNKKNNNVGRNYVKNAFYKRQTFDLFTSEPIYEYINPRTNELIRSTNPNLAEKLNADLIKNKKNRRKSSNNEKKEKIKINHSPDFSKLKFKF